jgi:hypothetical protein
LASALALGARGRGFESRQPDTYGDFRPSGLGGSVRAVKVALEPRSLERSLRELGWVIEVKPLAGPFLLGLGGRAG